MHDARDAEDTRLLEAGELNALVESYYETIILRCRLRCRSEDDALDCAQAVALRLLSELKRGRRYPVPYRVVVAKVIEWTTKGFYGRGRAVLVELDENLPEDVFAQASNPYEEVEARYDTMGGPNGMFRFDSGSAFDAGARWIASGATHHNALARGRLDVELPVLAEALGIEEVRV